MTAVSDPSARLPGTTYDGPLDELPIVPRQALVLVICLLLNLADGFDVLAMAYAAPAISAAWSVEPEALGIVFSCALAGMTLGSLFLAPLSDVYGRRRVVLIAAFCLSLAMLGTALAQNVWQLGALRFVSGLGIGVLVPASAAMATEFAPRSWRNASVVMVAAGFSFGAVSAGFAAEALLERFDWRGMFLAGGVLTAVLAVLAFFLLCESLDFIASQPLDASTRLERINRVLRSLGRRGLSTLPARAPQDSHSGSVRTLLSMPLRQRTILLWIFWFAYMWSSYLLSNWIPSLFVHAGYTRAEGIAALTWWTTGALIGALVLGAASTRFTLPGIVSGMLLCAAVAAAVWVTVPGLPLQVQLWLIGGIGFMLSAIYGVYAIVAGAYPATVRTTGLGWCIGVGRIGAIVSPIVTGFLVARAWPLDTLMLTLLVPTLVVSAVLVWHTARFAAPTG